MEEVDVIIQDSREDVSSPECAHCGDPCLGSYPVVDEHAFCCNGCQVIYTVLQQSGLGAYYHIESLPGISQRTQSPRSYEYLDDLDVIDKMLDFKSGSTARIRFYLPQIHCSSCIWLLENISQLNSGVIFSRINFMEKQASITFNIDQISLHQVVELLSKIGYEPKLSFNDLGTKQEKFLDRSLLYKIGLAGFSFGNIMLLSFPEYLGFQKASLLFYLGYLNLLLALPVLLYSGRDYIVSAWKSIRVKSPSIDVPVALGMIVLFGRSVYEILSATGEGYLDSFAGFVFFLLIGKWFQNYTYQSLSFEHGYKSYFPISAHLRSAGHWISRSIDQLKAGDHIMVKNEEIIPCDGVLLRGEARIDYSFVTGESDPQRHTLGETIWAGGKQKGAAIELEVLKSVDQSYLTQLWNEDVFHKLQKSTTSRFINVISQHFTWVILTIAVAMLAFWWQIDSTRAFQVFTSVLIVACPCALALSVPFIYGNAIRLLAGHKVYFKNTEALESIQDIDTVIFDKTGTITDLTRIDVIWVGEPLGCSEVQLIASLAGQSSHPLSLTISDHLNVNSPMMIDEYEEHIGLGTEGYFQGTYIRIGSAEFIFDMNENLQNVQSVFVEIDGLLRGHFEMENHIRENIPEIITQLSKRYTLGLLSGDSSTNQDRINALFDTNAVLRYHQKPKEKLAYIKNLQDSGHRVMMIGDGLNDAGALKQSNIGVVIASDNNNFNPACDTIIGADTFKHFDRILRFAYQLKYVLYGALVIAFLYNSIGLYFAVTGQLSPVIAAILMPTSSLSVMLYGVVMSSLVWRMNRR